MSEMAMTKEQFETVMSEIEKYHKFGRYYQDKKVREKNKHIKYVRPSWDMRDGMCFSVKFEGLTCGMVGKTFGSGEETVPLFNRIMEWLNKPLPSVITHNQALEPAKGEDARDNSQDNQS